MSDLTEFLLARLAEDEEAARAATPGEWTAVGTHFLDDTAPEDMVSGYVDIFPGGPVVVEQEIAGPNAVHIARHDPARVLAECEAKRRIIGWHRATEADAGDEKCCATCDVGQDGWAEGHYPCSTLKALASVYADHPEYREEWRP